MGAKLSLCARNDSHSPPRLQLQHDSTYAAEDYGGEGKEVSNMTTEGSSTSAQQHSNSASSHSVFNVNNAIDQIFILCESGILSTIEFILEAHPETIVLLNTRHACHINEVQMDLTPLQIAAACGHADVVSFLLNVDPLSVDLTDSAFGMNALHLAAYLNKVAVVEVLCRDLRLDIMTKDHDGKTALHIATLHGYDFVVETILRMRPSIDMRCREDLEGNTFIHCAAKLAKEQLLQLFVDYIDTQSHVTFAGMKESLRIQQQLRHRKSILEMMNFQGETAERIVQSAIEDLQNRIAVLHRTVTIASATVEGKIDDDNDTISSTSEVDMRLERELLDRLDANVACLSLIQESCHYSPVHDTSLSSFGAHTGSSSSSSEDHKQDKAAYSWSPRRGRRGTITSESNPTSPLELHID